MIERLSHATIYVLDQDRALKFYRDKLGFEVRMDHKMDHGFRWLTVAPPGQKDLELVLMAPTEAFMGDAESLSALRTLIQKGKMGAGVFFTSDCRKTHQELCERGVEFVSPPQEKFYGVEAMFKDDSGNWFSLTERTSQ
jgi:catechol 2,3-dioxygenase-like lactoylglutathione lyase family enzyme